MARRSEESMRSLLHFAALGIALLSAGLNCLGQSQRYLLEETTIKGGMQEQFEAAQKEYCAAVVRGGAPSCVVFSPTALSSPNRYWTLLSFGSFGHYDEGTYTSKGMTPEQARDLSARRTPTIVSNVESAIARKEAVESTGAVAVKGGAGSSESEQSPIVLILEVHVTPGEGPALLKLLSEYELAGAGGAGALEVYQTVVDGDPDRLFLVRHLANFAALDGVSAPGSGLPAGRRERFEQAYARYVRSCLVTVMRSRAELSAFAR